MSWEFHAVDNDLPDGGFQFPEFLRDGVSVLVAVGALVDLQHDGNAVGIALFCEDGVRDIAAGVGVVDSGGISGVFEGGLDCLGQLVRGVTFVCPDADIRCWLVLFQKGLRDDLVGVAVYIQQQDPGMAAADFVHSFVVGSVVFQRFPFQVLCDVFDGCSVICLLIAEAHAVLFHNLFRAGEAFHITEQAADREGCAHVPAAVGSRDRPEDVRVPHFLMVSLELFRGDDH